MGLFGFISDWIRENPGKAVGAFIGFLFGILVFTIGIIKTLLITVFVLIGYVIGKSRDENISILEKIQDLFRRKR
ncbi:MAG: DUF2273 domain-containing protein [Spirochaetes bacterium]|jgi:uncharacterized membrane protein|nr:DUF2273 domain-containing protein [Spirochaetota bacterium]